MPKPAKPAVDAPTRPRGRPTVYSKAVADEICRRLADGEGLKTICRSEGMPPESTVREWALDDREGFAAPYLRAREIGYARMAEEIVEISDDGTNDWMERNAPDNAGWQANGEHTQRSRLRVDTRKWLLSKVLPKIYGDRTEITGAGGGPLQVELTAEEAARRVAFVLAAGLHAKSKPAEPDPDIPSTQPTRSD